MTETRFYECDICGKRMKEPKHSQWTMTTGGCNCQIQMGANDDGVAHICQECQAIAVQLTVELWKACRARPVDRAPLVSSVVSQLLQVPTWLEKANARAKAIAKDRG